MSTAPPINRQWPEDEQQNSSKNYALSGRIMLASIIILFVVVVFLVLLHLYARWYLLRLQLHNVGRRRNLRRNRSNRRIVVYVDDNRAVASSFASGGLDASVLNTLPLFVYSSESDRNTNTNTNTNTPECAVCLSEFEDGETGRVLPKCKHSFHTGCIDMWFYSNSTCPLCRSPVQSGELEMTIPVQQRESVPEPGSITSSSTGSSTSPISPVQPETRKRVDVRIDVPDRNELSPSQAENEFRLLSPSQGFRSPGSRLLSLKRIMNMGRKSPAVSPSSGVGTSFVSVVAESDLESARDESTHESSRPGSFS